MSNNVNEVKKKAMVQALEKSLGVVQVACKNAEISRQTHYNWLKEDSEYRLACEDIKNIALDFAETQLMHNIGKKKEASIFFYLKTQGKERGYIERQEFATKDKDGNDLGLWNIVVGKNKEESDGGAED